MIGQVFALEMLVKRAGVNETGGAEISPATFQALRERPAYKRAMEKVGKNIHFGVNEENKFTFE